MAKVIQQRNLKLNMNTKSWGIQNFRAQRNGTKINFKNISKMQLEKISILII